MCFCFDENVLARSPQQAVRARLRFSGFFSRSFTCSGSLQSVERCTESNFFGEIKEVKVTSRRFHWWNCFIVWKNNNNFETNIFQKTRRTSTLKDETSDKRIACRTAGDWERNGLKYRNKKTSLWSKSGTTRLKTAPTNVNSFQIWSNRKWVVQNKPSNVTWTAAATSRGEFQQHCI